MNKAILKIAFWLLSAKFYLVFIGTVLTIPDAVIFPKKDNSVPSASLSELSIGVSSGVNFLAQVSYFFLQSILMEHPVSNRNRISFRAICPGNQ